MSIGLTTMKITLKEFYRMICDDFNSGGDLEYRFTKPDGYWTMTKGFITTGPRGIDVHLLAEHIKQIRAAELVKKKKSLPKKKKKEVLTKYK